MENVNFSALAPRVGSRPMMSTWNDIGNSSMNGGAFNWGSIWSGLKNFGSSVKNFGNKVWNSSTGQMLRDKLKETKAQEKLVDGLAAGVHGALDLANQEIAKAIDKRLDRPTLLPAPEPEAQVEEMLEESKEIGGKKRPPEEEEMVTVKPTAPPPPYEELVGTIKEPPPSYEEVFGVKDAPTMPMTRPIPSMARPVVAPTVPPIVDRPTTLDLPPPPSPPRRAPAFVQPAYSGPGGWQSTLNSIVGAGVRTVKRRRCFR
uniref:Pre-protein VI n=1 Tax=Pipistrellus pipistrellus adenovirus TaxID=3140007 RepID=A0AAU6S531_9ADEN